MKIVPISTVARPDPVQVKSGEDWLSGSLFLPPGDEPVPVVLFCHGAGEFKENYYEFAEYLAQQGIASLALDMHGHGKSEGARYQVDMREWVTDVTAAVEWLVHHPRIDANGIGALGLSSGGTAILEASLTTPGLKYLIPLDATVRDSMPLPVSLFMRLLVQMGKAKQACTGQPLRLYLMPMFRLMHLASDPEIDLRLRSNPETSAAFRALPFPGVSDAFFVNTLDRAGQIRIPTMVLWGGDDEIDSPKTGQALFDALRCEKSLHIIPGNGHVGHLDRNRRQVFELTAQWVLQNTRAQSNRRSCAAS